MYTVPATSQNSVDSDSDWEAMVRDHSGRVFGHAYRLTGNRADAEDITQEVFVRALRSSAPAGRGGATGRAEGWLNRVTTNLFLDLVRRRRRSADTLLDHRRAGWEPVDAAADPGSVALRDELDDDVEAALASLPPTYREAVVLYDVHGLRCAEIAELVGIKPGTVRTRIHRGRRLLRDALAHRAPTPGRARHGGPHEQSVEAQALTVS